MTSYIYFKMVKEQKGDMSANGQSGDMLNQNGNASFIQSIRPGLDLYDRMTMKDKM
jgi:hypothetical protein